ncbi:MAG: hypothetical protein J7L34_08680, partial [Thermotogaceae bacterium]|nr:hypothetical protein [Thermotogaceae bacterium]
MFDEVYKKIIANSKEMFCKCFDKDNCYIKRVLNIDSISFKSNVTTFSYRNLGLDIGNLPFLYDLKDF